MRFETRDYQNEAVNSGISWIKKSIDNACIMAPTGAGKALLCAMIANEYSKLSNDKKTLVLVPSATLCRQNYQTYLDYAQKPASIYSASAGEKCIRHNVVIGTPGSVKNHVGKFNGFGLVIIDECHEIAGSVKIIIDRLREKNQHLRVLGMTATPFRMGTGYIYRNHYLRGKVPQDQCSEESYFHTCIYEISTRMLIGRDYLTKPVFDHTEIEYDTSALVKNRTGLYNAESVEQCFVGKGRLTADIVADVVDKSKQRNRVLWFAATIQHAHEIAESLPKHNTRVVTGETPKKDLEEILKRFEHGDIRHVINVSMLHRGFDNPVIDTIAILRATESAALYLQIIGRGLRLHESKNECLILDYAQNLEALAPHGDIFEPDIRSYISLGGSGEIEVSCPLCSGTNIFSSRKNDDGYILGADGYFKDLAGAPIKNLAGIEVPSHYGRRCLSEVRIAGKHTQCEYRWSFKECHECKSENDIAAKYCHKCRAELIDPHEKLQLEYAKMANDPYRIRILPVEYIDVRQWPGKEGKPDTIRVDYGIAESPNVVSEWFSPSAESAWMLNRWFSFASKAWDENVVTIDDALLRKHEIKCPSEIAFKKREGSKFFEVKNVGW